MDPLVFIADYLSGYEHGMLNLTTGFKNPMMLLKRFEQTGAGALKVNRCEEGSSERLQGSFYKDRRSGSKETAIVGTPFGEDAGLQVVCPVEKALVNVIAEFFPPLAFRQLSA